MPFALLLEHAVADLSRTEDPLVIRSALGIIALAKRLPMFATVLLEFDEDEVRELLVAQYGAA